MSIKPQDVLSQAYAEFANDQIAISFSGAEDVVLLDMATRLRGTEIRVFTLDTGRLHAMTLEFIEEVRNHYGITIEVLMPDALEIEKLVREKGLFSFFEDGHLECCGIRKVQPLQRHLIELNAWITGQRRDQSATRTSLPHRQLDPAFSTPAKDLIKYNPLADWTSDEVWKYIQEKHVPYNRLHDRGYLSIGCEPCTRAVKPGESERAGRWWWEHEDEKECGLHAQNINDTQTIRITSTSESSSN